MGSGISWLRRPKTLQEIRENKAMRLDNDLIESTGQVMYVRPKRINLPTEWDDLERSHETKCWKRYRLTQYREVVC